MKRLAELVIYLALEGFYYFNGIRKWISDIPVPPEFRLTSVDPYYIKAGTNAITSDVVEPFVSPAKLLRRYLPTGKSGSGTTLRHQCNRSSERSF